MESVILRYVRNDYGKKIRKLYEQGGVVARRCEMRTVDIRNDGVCNTISTVQKDNLLLVHTKST